MWPFEETVPEFRGLNMSDLSIDEAWLNISSSFPKPVWLYIVSHDCFKCAFKKLMEDPVLPNHSYRAIVNVRHDSTFRFRASDEPEYPSVVNDSFKLCDLDGNLGEFGVYSISIHSDDSNDKSVLCNIKTDLEPVNIYWPLIAVLTFWMVLTFLSNNWGWFVHGFGIFSRKVLSCLIRQQGQPDRASLLHENVADEQEGINQRSSTSNTGNPEDVTETGNSTIDNLDGRRCELPPTAEVCDDESAGDRGTIHLQQSQKQRLKSLDAFRGLCLIIMIFVDDGGGGFFFLQHSTWDGLYFADLAFPWFLWICGVCIPFSLHSKIAVNGSSKLQILKEVGIRSLKLILLGIFVNTSTRSTAVKLENLRLPGVLQRFGICYFVGSVLFLCTSKPSSTEGQESEQMSWKDYFNLKDVKTAIFGWSTIIVLVAVHSAVTFVLPVPGCQTGYLGPAGLHEDNSYPPHCVGGATGYLDRIIFGVHHIHNRPTSKLVYGSGAFDPEGCLGILTSILHIWLGVQTGITLLTYKRPKDRLWRFAVWSLICGVGGRVLSGGDLNQGLIPVNKNLWSLSFVLITTSVALLLLALLYVTIDVRQMWSGSPLMESGMNSIFLYLAHEVCHATLPFHYSYGTMRTHFSRLIESSWGTALWVIIAIYLHKRKTFFVV